MIDNYLDCWLNMVEPMIEEMEERREERKKNVLKQWKESRLLPRKKKKALRKELLFEWSILEFDLNNLFN